MILPFAHGKAENGDFVDRPPATERIAHDTPHAMGGEVVGIHQRIFRQLPQGADAPLNEGNIHAKKILAEQGHQFGVQILLGCCVVQNEPVEFRCENFLGNFIHDSAIQGGKGDGMKYLAASNEVSKKRLFCAPSGGEWTRIKCFNFSKYHKRSRGFSSFRNFRGFRRTRFSCRGQYTPDWPQEKTGPKFNLPGGPAGFCDLEVRPAGAFPIMGSERVLATMAKGMHYQGGGNRFSVEDSGFPMRI